MGWDFRGLKSVARFEKAINIYTNEAMSLVWMF